MEITLIVVIAFAVIAAALLVTVFFRALALSDTAREYRRAKADAAAESDKVTYKLTIVQQEGEVSLESGAKIGETRGEELV